MNINLRQKSAFAIQHLMAAARFSRQCGDIQKRHMGQPLGGFFDEQIACVSATVMLCIASLESNINEYLSEPAKLFLEISLNKANEFIDLIGNLSILDKYERVLSFKECEDFDRGSSPFQDVDILIKLRNEFVHFHPEWHDKQERHDKLGKKLLYKFELSPFIEESSVLFPQRIISHGCTKWAVTSSIEFIEDFDKKIGVNSKLLKLKSRLEV